jgi:hypothetical protein
MLVGSGVRTVARGRKRGETTLDDRHRACKRVVRAGSKKAAPTLITADRTRQPTAGGTCAMAPPDSGWHGSVVAIRLPAPGGVGGVGGSRVNGSGKYSNQPGPSRTTDQSAASAGSQRTV